MKQATPTCRHCGCTAENPCRLCTGDECAWLTSARDVCSRPSCVLAELAAERATERKRRQDVAAAVLPIAQRWVQAKRLDKERRARRLKRRAKQARRAA